MAATELKIDDDYVKEMGTYLSTELNELDTAYQEYLTIMTGIKTEGLMAGATADALEKFIEYAEYLKEKSSELGETAKKLCNDYITDVDTADSYLF